MGEIMHKHAQENPVAKRNDQVFNISFFNPSDVKYVHHKFIQYMFTFSPENILEISYMILHIIVINFHCNTLIHHVPVYI